MKHVEPKTANCPPLAYECKMNEQNMYLKSEERKEWAERNDETVLRVLFCEPFNLFDTQIIVYNILCPKRNTIYHRLVSRFRNRCQSIIIIYKTSSNMIWQSTRCIPKIVNRKKNESFAICIVASRWKTHKWTGLTGWLFNGRRTSLCVLCVCIATEVVAAARPYVVCRSLLLATLRIATCVCVHMLDWRVTFVKQIWFGLTLAHMNRF